jgi:hypothetical protein
MPRRQTRYVVCCPDRHVARFSEQWHARMFAIALSERMRGYLIEMSAPDGLIGQYRDGYSTPEFDRHHISGQFNNCYCLGAAKR